MAITSTVALARDPAVVDAINSREGLETGDISELETGNFTEIEVRLTLLAVILLVTDLFWWGRVAHSQSVPVKRPSATALASAQAFSVVVRILQLRALG